MKVSSAIREGPSLKAVTKVGPRPLHLGSALVNLGPVPECPTNVTTPVSSLTVPKNSNT
jgi:hypothetical protein